MKKALIAAGPLEAVVRRRPWANWSFWPWARYTLSWKGRKATMQENEHYAGQLGWKLHCCADGRQCRASIPGGCARGWCAHYEVTPDEAQVPRFPRSRLLTPKPKPSRLKA